MFYKNNEVRFFRRVGFSKMSRYVEWVIGKVIKVKVNFMKNEICFF